jgi:DNA replication protein DnaC
MLHFNSLRLVFNLNRGLFKIKSCKSLICEFRRAVLKEERVLSESYNKMIQSFNFLIIGRCGSGKSATTR